ncbi:hypothetical protein [Rossellomorea aquimaris]|nr:hypothetical protein [Rossellomorea aquimaris]
MREVKVSLYNRNADWSQVLTVMWYVLMGKYRIQADFIMGKS